MKKRKTESSLKANISHILHDYLQSKTVQIKKGKDSKSCTLIVKPSSSDSVAHDVQQRLQCKGYIISIKDTSSRIPRESSDLLPIDHRMTRFKTHRHVISHNSICLKVIAPNPPVNPAPFPDPNGIPKKEKK